MPPHSSPPNSSPPKENSLLKALTKDVAFPAYLGELQAYSETQRPKSFAYVPRFARRGDKNYYFSLVDTLLLQDATVRKTLNDTLVVNSTHFFVNNEAGVTAVANLFLVDVASKALQIFINTLPKAKREVLGSGFAILPQSYSLHGATGIVLDLKFVRVFGDGKHKADEKGFFVIEYKGPGKLRLSSYDKVYIEDEHDDQESAPSRFQGDAGQTGDQLGKYLCNNNCSKGAIIDTVLIDAYFTDKMEIDPVNSRNTKVGDSCMITRISLPNEFRRFLAGAFIDAYLDERKPAPSKTPSQLSVTLPPNVGSHVDPNQPSVPRRSTRNTPAGTRDSSPSIHTLPDRTVKADSTDDGSDAHGRNTSPHASDSRSDHPPVDSGGPDNK